MRIVYRSMAITLAALSLSGRASAAPVETVLYRFTGIDGIAPYAGLIADMQGALYGTTPGSGRGKGTIFKLTPPGTGQTAWTETVLYIFCSQPRCSDGGTPFAGLIADMQGALYGTTVAGGAGNGGTVFKLAAKSQTAWRETVLYRFAGGSDGLNPTASLIFDKDGALYGTTNSGGSAGNYGTVFKVTFPRAKAE